MSISSTDGSHRAYNMRVTPDGVVEIRYWANMLPSETSVSRDPSGNYLFSNAYVTGDILSSLVCPPGGCSDFSRNGGYSEMYAAFGEQERNNLLGIGDNQPLFKIVVK